MQYSLKCSLNQPNAPIPSPSFAIDLSLSSLEQLGVLLRVSLFDIALSHLLHHEVTVDNNILSQLAVCDTPLAGDSQDTDRRLCVDEGIDTVGGVDKG